MTDRLVSLILTASPEPDDDMLNQIGWGAVALLIVGASLAVASVAWFLIGLFVN